MFCKAEVKSATFLKVAFNRFSAYSGLEADEDKSHSVVAGVDDTASEELLRITVF